MAEAGKYTVVLSAVDKVSEVLRSIEGPLSELEKTAAKASKAFNIPNEPVHTGLLGEIEKHFGSLNKKISESSEKFEGLGEKIKHVGETALDILPALSVLGGVTSIAGLAETIKSTAEMAEQLNDIGKSINAPVASIQALDYAGKQAGVSTDVTNRSLQRLSVTIGQAASGQNKKAAELFKAMGISLKDAHGHIVSVMDVMPKLEASFNKSDPSMRSAMAQVLIGRQGVDMLPLFAQDPNETKKSENKFHDLGYSFKGKDAENLEKFNQSFNDASLAVSGLGTEIGAKLAPVLGPVLEQFSSWIGKNKEFIATDISQHVSNFIIGSKYLGYQFHNLTSSLGSFRDHAESTFESLKDRGENAFHSVGRNLGSFEKEAGHIWHSIPSELKESLKSADAALNKFGKETLHGVEDGWKDFQKGLHTIFDTISRDFHKVFDPITDKLDVVSQDFGSWLNHKAETESTPGGSGNSSNRQTKNSPVFRGWHAPLEQLPPTSLGNGTGGAKHQLHVTFHNSPADMRVNSVTSGDGEAPIIRQDVGYNGMSRDQH